MAGKAKPAPGRRARASGSVVAGRRDTQKNNPTTDETQERQIYRGRTFLGTVREVSEGAFVTVVDEQVIGPYDTIRAATDALLELARAGAQP